MTKLLEQAVAAAEKLSPDEQDALPQWILDELASEQRWDEAFARSQDALAKLADEALPEYRAGLIGDQNPNPGTSISSPTAPSHRAIRHVRADGIP